MYCRNCGYQLNDGAKFCPKCGMPVENQVSQDQTNVFETKEEDNLLEKRDENTPRRNSRKIWKTAAIVAAVVLAAGVGYKIYDAKFAYHYLSDFEYNGLVQVERNHKLGFMNEDKKVVVPCKYREVSIQDDGYGTLELELDGAPNFVNENGELRYKEVTTVEDSNFYIAEQDGKYGILNHEGQEAFPVKYKKISVEAPSGEGLFLVSMDKKSAFVNYDGGICYSNVGKFGKNGIAVAQNTEAKWGFVNQEGTEITPCQYQKIGEFNEYGLAKAEGGHTGKKIGYVNTDGEEVIPVEYDWVYETENDGVIYAESANLIYYGTTQAHFFDTEGNKLYDFVNPMGICEGYTSTSVKDGQSYFVVDENGKKISEKEYDYIDEADWNRNFIVRQGTKVGLVSGEGKEIIEPSAQYIEEAGLYPDEDGLYIVHTEKKFSVISGTGEYIIPEQEGELVTVSMAGNMYQKVTEEDNTEIRDFQGNLLYSGIQGEWHLRPDGLILFRHDLCNRKGERILLDEDEVGEINSTSLVDEAIIYSRKKDDEERYGMISMTGEEIFPCIYDLIYYVPEKEVYFYSKKGRSGMMDKNRNIVWEKEYDGLWIYKPYNEREWKQEEIALVKKKEYDGIWEPGKKEWKQDEIALVKKNEKYGLVNWKNGEIIRDCEYEAISRKNEYGWYLVKNDVCTFWNAKDDTYEELFYAEDMEIFYDYDTSYNYPISVGYLQGEEIVPDWGFEIRQGDKTGYIDRYGNYIITPEDYSWFRYDEINQIFEIMADEETKSVLDSNGHTMIPWGNYEEIEYGSNLIYVETETGESYCMDYDGNCVIYPEENAESSNNVSYLVTYSGENCCLRNSKGEVISEGEYDWISSDSDNNLIMVRDNNGYYGYINSDGEEAIPCIYSDAYEFADGLAIVMNEEEKWGVINTKGEVVADFQYDSVEENDNYYDGMFGMFEEISRDNQKILLWKKKQRRKIL